MTEQRELEFFFQPFSALEFNEDTPVMCIVFENQSDLILSNSFPEVNATREMLDKIRDRDDETVAIFGAKRNDTTMPLGIIYVRQPWRRRRGKSTWDIDGINFYRELWQRTTLATRRVRASNFKDFVIVLPSSFRPENIKNDKRQEKRLENFVRIVVEAIVYANHSLDEFLKDAPPRIESVTLVYFGEADREITTFFRKAMQEGQLIGQATGNANQLIQLPSNHKTPLQFLRRITGVTVKPKTTKSKSWHRVSGHSFSSRTKVSYLYGKDGIKRFGFGLIHSVGQGAGTQPVFLKLHYRPSTTRQKKIKRVVLIGKGIVFDTGGSNLKESGDLDKMHYDVTGAATVINIVKLADDMNLPVEIISLTPILENANSRDATRPDNVVRAYNGENIEVKDTDAEGRLIIADSVSYAERHLKADFTVTVGTLGDMSEVAPDIIQVGYGNPNLRRKIIRAENASTEKIHLLPSLDHLNEVYNEHLGSIGDFRNYPTGGYYFSSGFVFIYHFFHKEAPEWVFVDPNIVFEDDADNYGSGPGFGLKFIWNLIRQYA